jgi:hypothetical protein
VLTCEALSVAEWPGRVQVVCTSLEGRLREHAAQTAQWELQARALAAELTKAQSATTQVGRALLPALTGVELRLAQVVSLVHVKAALSGATPLQPAQK